MTTRNTDFQKASSSFSVPIIANDSDQGLLERMSRNNRIHVNPNFKLRHPVLDNSSVHINPKFLAQSKTQCIHVNPKIVGFYQDNAQREVNLSNMVGQMQTNANAYQYVSKNKLVRGPVARTKDVIIKKEALYMSKTKVINATLAFESPKKINYSPVYGKPKQTLKVNGIKIMKSSKSRYKVDRSKKGFIEKRKITQSCNVYKLDHRKVLPRNYLSKNKFKIQKLFPRDLYRPNPTNSHCWKSYTWHKSTTQETTTILREQSKAGSMSVVKIGGILYKTTPRKLTRTNKKPIDSASHKKQHALYVRGEKFLLEKHGKILRRDAANKSIVKRIDIGGVTYTAKSKTVLIRTDTHRARHLVHHAKQKSIATLLSRLKKNNVKCPVFCRIGRCTKHESGLCHYVHDAKHVALCKRMLQGSCEDRSCLLSHSRTLVEKKIATCHFYLQGLCVREDCPYLHVKVNHKAGVCSQFLQGFCSLGKSCNKKHIFKCPNFDRRGKCSKGKKCPYPHVRKPAGYKGRREAIQQPRQQVTKDKESQLRYYKAQDLNTATNSQLTNSSPAANNSLPLPCYIPLPS